MEYYKNDISTAIRLPPYNIQIVISPMEDSSNNIATVDKSKVSETQCFSFGGIYR